MLVLSRKLGESIVVQTPSGEVVFKILEQRKKEIRVGIEAPQSIHILREELCLLTADAGEEIADEIKKAS
jgi:carbon storage regulator CsrA